MTDALAAWIGDTLHLFRRNVCRSLAYKDDQFILLEDPVCQDWQVALWPFLPLLRAAEPSSTLTEQPLKKATVAFSQSRHLGGNLLRPFHLGS